MSARIPKYEQPAVVGLTATQIAALRRLLAISLDWPNEVVPTRQTGLNMGTVRSLEAKRMIAWHRLPNAMGVRVTPEGRDLVAFVERGLADAAATA